MGFLEKCLEVQQNDPRCPIAKIIEEIDDGEEFKAVLENRAIQHKTIRTALRESGYPVGDRAVNNHRNGYCSCFKVA